MTLNPTIESNLVPISPQPATPPAPPHREVMVPCPHLTQALAAARDRCRPAAKDGVNTFHKYRYASADEVIQTATSALENSGLVLLPQREELTVIGTGSLACYALNRVLILSHTSGEYVPLIVEGWPIVPERGRPLDKAYAIALTTSLAYKLRDLLQMPRGDQQDDVAAQNDTPRQAQSSAGAEAPPVNPPAAPQAQECLTGPEYQELVALARQYKRTQAEVKVLCCILHVPVLEKAPHSKFLWLVEALTQGLATAEVVDRISRLIEALQLDWITVRQRLQEVYQVETLAHLLPSQIVKVETRLKALQSKRQAPQPAA